MQKLKPVKPEDMHIGCVNCSTVGMIAPLSTIIAVGFGAAYVTRDGHKVYDGEADLQHDRPVKTLADIEKMASIYTNSDWRLVLAGPMHGETYQRQEITHELMCGPLGDNLISADKRYAWVMVESNRGFA